MGSDSATDIVATGSGDLVLGLDDDYLVTDDADGTGSPAVTHLFGGPTGLLRLAQATTTAPGNDDIDWSFDVNVPAGERVIVMHFLVQSTDRATAIVRGDELRVLPANALADLLPNEQAEIANFFAYPDADLDRLSDADEAIYNTDPLNPDSDFDGILDGIEVENGLDPNDDSDGNGDIDEDGLLTRDEFALGTDYLDPDTDDDGLLDGDEVFTHLTDPLAADSDGDLLSDGDEVLVYLTDPLVSDTDAGGREDGAEVLFDGTDPTDPLEENLPVEVALAGFISDPRTIVGPAGEVHVLWQEVDIFFGGGDVNYSLLTDDLQTAIDVTPILPGGGAIADLAVDSSGRLHVLVISGSSELVYQVLDPALDDQDGSSADQAVIQVVPPTTVAYIVPDPSSESHQIDEAHLVLDEFDTPHLTWLESREECLIEACFPKQTVHYQRLSGGGLVEVAVDLGERDAETSSSGGAIAVDASANVHLVWAGEDDAVDTLFYWLLDGSNGSVLIDATILEPATGPFAWSPRLAIGSDGQLRLAYGRFDVDAYFRLTLDPALDDQNGDAADASQILSSPPGRDRPLRSRELLQSESRDRRRSHDLP